MTASFIVNGDQVTVRYEYTASLEKVQTTVADAAHYLYDRHSWAHIEDANGDVIPFENLTNNQLLTVLDRAIVRYHFACAEAFWANLQADTARDAAIVEASDKYLGGG